MDHHRQNKVVSQVIQGFLPLCPIFIISTKAFSSMDVSTATVAITTASNVSLTPGIFTLTLHTILLTSAPCMTSIPTPTSKQTSTSTPNSISLVLPSRFPLLVQCLFQVKPPTFVFTLCCSHCPGPAFSSFSGSAFLFILKSSHVHHHQLTPLKPTIMGRTLSVRPKTVLYFFSYSTIQPVCSR